MTTVRKVVRAILCSLGVHGPNWYGRNYGRTSVAFERQCPHCGEKWYGTEVEVWDRYLACPVRTVGDFRTEKQLRESGEWKGE